MARKPNYKFERMERERAKALKKAERAKAKAERAAKNKPQDTAEGPSAEQADGATNPADVEPPATRPG